MLKFVQGLTVTGRIYGVALLTLFMAGIIDMLPKYFGIVDVSVHLAAAGLASLGAVLLVLVTIKGEPSHLPYTLVGFTIHFAIRHMVAGFGLQNVVSGPWNTTPIYVWLAVWAIPAGMFIDFMVWASKPYRDRADKDTTGHNSRTDPDRNAT